MGTFDRSQQMAEREAQYWRMKMEELERMRASGPPPGGPVVDAEYREIDVPGALPESPSLNQDPKRIGE